MYTIDIEVIYGDEISVRKVYNNLIFSVKYFPNKEILRVSCSDYAEPDTFLYSYKYEVLGSGFIKLIFYRDYAELFEFKTHTEGFPSHFLYADSTNSNRYYRKNIKKILSDAIASNKSIDKNKNSINMISEMGISEKDHHLSGLKNEVSDFEEVFIDRSANFKKSQHNIRELWNLYLSLIYGGLTYPLLAYLIKICGAIAITFAVKDPLFLQAAFYLYSSSTSIKILYAYSKNFLDFPNLLITLILCIFPIIELFFPIIFTSGLSSLYFCFEVYALTLICAFIFQKLLKNRFDKSTDLRFMFKLVNLLGVLLGLIIFNYTLNSNSLPLGVITLLLFFLIFFPKWYAYISNKKVKINK